MTTAVQSPRRAGFAEGDTVAVRRVLTHPAWMHRVDGRDVGMSYLARTDIPELIGMSAITETRTRSAIRVVNGELVHTSVPEVRLASGFWYDAATGAQVDSGATSITRIAG